MREIRVFLAAPNDVAEERRCLERLLERLNEGLGGAALLRLVENDPTQYLASGQGELTNPADCDLVLAVFRGRIGTEPPADFAPMADGRPFPSLSAYELLTALAAREKSGRPAAVHILRNQSPPLGATDLDNAARLSALQRQWARLKDFLDPFPMTETAGEDAAIQPYQDSGDFELQVTRILRRWLDANVIGPRAAIWPTANKGSPFPGMSAFGVRHASVFFGRDGDLSRALDALRDCSRADDRLPFLLVVGPTAAGKSSLIRAGIIPRLTAPGSVLEVDNWRVAVMRPGDHERGPLAELCERLFDGLEDIPARDSGRPEALPELARGLAATPADLVDRLADGDEGAADPVLRALDMAGLAQSSLREDGRHIRTDLALVVDSLEDLFAAEVTSSDRVDFLNALWTLAATRRVWIIAGLRAASYDRFVGTPLLSALKGWGASVDLAPPEQAELLAMIRRPADAAALVLETHPTTGETLDQRLLSRLPEQNSLATMQHALACLFDARESTSGGEQVLTFAALDALGPLGELADRLAEERLASVPAGAQAALPVLLHQLVGGGPDGLPAMGGLAPALHLRSVEKHRLDLSAEGDRLVGALAEGGFVEVEQVGEVTRVRLVHLRLIWQWRRLGRILADTARLSASRERLENDLLRWLQAGSPDKLLIPAGRQLDYAQELVRETGGDLPQDMVQFVGASAARARAGLRRVRMVAVVAVVLALGAGGWAVEAWMSAQSARSDQQQAELAAQQAEAARRIALEQADKAQQAMRAAEKMAAEAKRETQTHRSAARQAGERATQAETAARQAEEARRQAETRLGQSVAGIHKALDQLAATLPEIADPSQVPSTAVLVNLEQALQTLVLANPDDPETSRVLSRWLPRLGEIYLDRGDLQHAAQTLEQNLALQRGGKAEDPAAQRGLIRALTLMARLHLRLGDGDDAMTLVEESLALGQKLSDSVPGSAEDRLMAAETLELQAAIYQDMGNWPAALPVMEQALASRRNLLAAEPRNISHMGALAALLERIGDGRLELADPQGAGQAYEEALVFRRGVLAASPEDAARQSALAALLEKQAGTLERSQQPQAALAPLRESLALRQALVNTRPEDESRKADLLTVQDRMRRLSPETAQLPDSLSAADQLTALRHQLDAKPGDSALVRRLAAHLDRLGRDRLDKGDHAGAVEHFQESLKLRRALTQSDAGTPADSHAMALTMGYLGQARRAAGDPSAAAMALDGAIDLLRRLVAENDGETAWRRDLATVIEHRAALRQDQKDLAAALKDLEDSLSLRTILLDGVRGEATAGVFADHHGLWNRIALLRRQMGDLSGARQAYQAGLALLTHAAAPTTIPDDWQWQLSLGREGLGDLNRLDGEMKAALADYQRARDLRRSLLTRHPDQPSWREALDRVNNKIGAVTGADDRPKPALAGLESGLSERRELLRTDPDNRTLMAELITTLAAVAEGRRTAGDDAGADEALEEGVALADRLAKGGPLAPDLARRRIDMLVDLGQRQVRRNAWVQAAPLLKKALALLEAWPTASGDPPDRRLDLLNGLIQVADASGDAAAALAHAEAAATLMRERLAAQPDDPGARAALAARLEDLGARQEQADNPSLALEHWQEALALRRALTGTPGADPPAMRADMVRVATLKKIQGDDDGARDLWMELLPLQRQHAASVDEIRDLVGTLIALAEDGAARKDHGSALDFYKEAAPLTRRLTEMAPDDTVNQALHGQVMARLEEAELRDQPAPGSLAALEKSLPADRDRAGASPADRLDLARKLEKIAELKAAADDRGGQLAALDESLTHWRVLAADKSGAQAAQRASLLSVLRRYAQAQRQAGDDRGAMNTLSEAMTVAKIIQQEQPDAVDPVKAVLEIGDDLGALAAAFGETGKALGPLEHNLALRHHLMAANPDDQTLMMGLARNLSLVRKLRHSEGDRAGVWEAYREMMALDRRLSELRPDEPEWRYDLADGLGHMGEAERLAGDLAAAAPKLGESLELARDLASGAPGNISWQRALVQAQTRAGHLALNEDRTEDAARLFAEAVGNQRHLVDANAGDQAAKTALLWLMVEQLRTQLRAGMDQAADKTVKQGLADLEKVRQVDEGHPEQRLLAAILLGLRGEVDLRLDRRIDGVEAISASVDQLRILVAGDGTNIRYREALAEALARDARLNRFVGNRLTATDICLEGVQLWRRLVEEDLDRADRTGRLAGILWQLARTTDDRILRRNSLEEGATILENLSVAGRLYPEYENLLADFRDALRE